MLYVLMLYVCNSLCGRQNPPPFPLNTHICIIIPRTSEYVTLYGKKDLACHKSLELGDYHGLSVWAQCYHKGIYK